MGKIRIKHTKDYKGLTIKVLKTDFKICKYINGYYAICLKNQYFGDPCVFGGKSGDDYNLNYIKEVYKNWDGTLIYEGYASGYKIQQ